MLLVSLCGCANLSDLCLYTGLYVHRLEKGCVLLCACTNNNPDGARVHVPYTVCLLRVCVYTCSGVIHECERLGFACVSLSVACVSSVLWGIDCVMSTNSNNNSSYAGCSLSLSYVVIRSGWKCGTTVPLNVTQRFSQAEDYRQKLAALLSPLRATCHHSSGHWSWSSPLPLAI